MPNPNNIQKKFAPGDRVAVDREALLPYTGLFPEGFGTAEGIIRWAGADMTYPDSILVDYIYTVELDQDPSVPNLKFKTAELSLTLPVSIKQLDTIIRDLDNQVAVLRTYRAARAKELGF